MITPKDIEKGVLLHSDVKTFNVDNREHPLAHLRFIYYTLCTEYTDLSYRDIADTLISKHSHCVVIHAKLKVGQWKESLDKKSKDLIEIYDNTKNYIDELGGYKPSSEYPEKIIKKKVEKAVNYYKTLLIEKEKEIKHLKSLVDSFPVLELLELSPEHVTPILNNMRTAIKVKKKLYNI